MIELSFILKEEDYEKALLQADRELAILSLKYNLPTAIQENQFLEEDLEVCDNLYWILISLGFNRIFTVCQGMIPNYFT